MSSTLATTRRRARPRPQAHLVRETELLEGGANLVAGMDEVGRGALAGPVTVGVTIVGRQTGPCPDGLTDSKLLSPALREQFVSISRDWCVAWGVGHASSAEIDRVGITAALRRAGMRALAVALREVGRVDALLLDGSHNWLAGSADLFSAADEEPDDVLGSAEVRMVVKGDETCASISAASVLAKCERDRIMVEAAAEHPEYGWESNKGYGAAAHVQALRTYGPTPLHRVSWQLPERVATSDGR